MFTILGYLKTFELDFNLNLFRVIVLLIVSLFLAKHISKINNRMLIISLLLIGKLFTFGHLLYDYIVLLPSFIYSYSNRKFTPAKISLFIIFYVWFGIRIIEYFRIYMHNGTIIPTPTPIEVFLNFLLLIILYYSNLKIKQSN